MKIFEREKDNFKISTDKKMLDIEMIHDFLSTQSYWAKKRSKEKTLLAIENSICFGLYENKKQIGFARVVTDFAVIAYLGDVFILEAYRGRSLSKWLMETILAYPELQGLRRWILATKDAHGLYKQNNFTALRYPERWMELSGPDAYLQD